LNLNDKGTYQATMRIHRGYTTSDFHLLTNRSSAGRMMPSLHQVAEEADLFVLNGDIFDFQWSVYPDLGESLDYVEKWIGDLLSRHRHCRFVFLMGNHDSLPAYGDLLDALTERHDNLAWEPFHLRLGSKVFLHGDVGSSSHSPEELAAYRQRWHGPRRRPWLHAAYLACTRLGIPRLIHECTPVKHYTTDVVAYLKAEMGPSFTELRDVYFGHTHKPVTDYQSQGLRFHNTGAMIHGVRSRLQTFTYDPDELQHALERSAETSSAVAE
jgi:calcineurin-like phosphoesterase family protein